MPSIINDAATPTPADKTQPDSSISNIETAKPATTGVSTYKPTEVPDPTEWTVTPEQTVAGQLQTIVDPNNPLMQRAKTRAQQASADRGLINSSIAATAGESAMLDAAMPIATADAGTQSKAAGYNVDIKNQTNVTNANLNNSADQFNAGQLNQQALQKMQQDSALTLQQSAKDYEKLFAVNSQAATMMSNATSAINNIMQNNQMDAATKTENMRQVTANLKAQLSILSSLQSLDLGSLLNNPYG